MKILNYSFILLVFLINGCVLAPKYKQSWDCADAKGIGCSSIEYADETARQQIVLNESSLSKSREKNKSKKKILVNQHEQDFTIKPIEKRRM